MRGESVTLENGSRITENEMPFFEKRYLHIQNYKDRRCAEGKKRVTFDLSKNKTHFIKKKDGIVFGEIVSDVENIQKENEGNKIEIVIESSSEASLKEERKQNIEVLCKLFSESKVQEPLLEPKDMDIVFPKIKDNPFVIRDKEE